MKRFVFKIFLFLIPLAVLVAGIEYYVRSIPNSYGYKYEYMKKNAGKIRTLVLGSSHAYRAFNPEYLPAPAFNLAYSSQDLKRDCYLLEHFIGSMDSLEYVILSFSYHTMPEVMEDVSQAKILLKYYGIYMGYPGVDFPMELTVPGWIDKVLMHLKGEKVLNCDSLGFGNDMKSAVEITERDAKSTLAYHTYASKDRVGENMGFLERMSGILESRGVKFVLVTTPVVEEYFINMSSEQYGLMLESVCELKRKFSNVIYINMIHDSRFGHDDFRDADHLNVAGAVKLTKIISDTLTFMNHSVIN